MKSRLFLSAALVLCGCATPTLPVTGPTPLVISRTPEEAPRKAAKRVPPPPPGTAEFIPFPAITTLAGPNGLAVDVIERRLLPLVKLTLLVGSGRADEGDRPGVAPLTLEYLREGGAGPYSPEALRARIDALGTNLETYASRDALTLSLAVPSDRLSDALELLGALVTRPRFAPAKFAKLKQRELERARTLLRTDGAAVARALLVRELFSQPLGIHPYASVETLPSELETLERADCVAFFRRHVTAGNSRLLVVGDVEPKALLDQVRQIFSEFRGAAPERPGLGEPDRIWGPRFTVADRPNSTQSEVWLGVLGPRRTAENFAQVAVLQQLVGGGVGGRLFRELREQKSLAYSTFATTLEVREGPSNLVLVATTEVKKTREVVLGLLEQLERVRTAPVTEEELATAQAALVHGAATRYESLDGLSRLLAQLRTLGEDERHFDTLRQEIGELTTFALASGREPYASAGAVVVVAGDAASIAPELATLGTVEVRDPSRDFAVTRRLPAAP